MDGKVDDLSREIGRRLQVAREEAGLTRREVATRLELSYHAYAHYERGERMPNLGLFLRLPRVLGRPLTCFLPGSVLAETGLDTTSDPALREVIAAWPDLPGPARDAVQDLVSLVLTCETLAPASGGKPRKPTLSQEVKP